jgi:hypothetical protein
MTEQRAASIAIGNQAGNNAQKTNAIAIGNQAGETNQSSQTVAMGYQAGQNNMGAYSVAIGYLAGQTNLQPRNLVLNASGTPLNATVGQNRAYVKPIRQANTATLISDGGLCSLTSNGAFHNVFWNSVTGEFVALTYAGCP